jgi:ABC-2 type transport system permease protein
MSLKRIGVLLGKEFWQGPKNIIFTMAIAFPLILSLAITLVFGTLFADTPRLGVVDEGSSPFVAMARDLASIDTREYGSASEMRDAVANGVVDIGIVLPEGFEGAVNEGRTVEITAYTWGESLARNRIILGVTIVNLVRDMAGQDAPVEVETVVLGDDMPVPWSTRLFPLVVLMAVFFGGLMLPASSVVLEKEKRTLQALVITPATAEDIFAAKALVGIILSLFAGIATLLLNQAFGAQPALLVLVLTLGAIMAAEIGLLLGAFLKDWTTLFTVWKTGAIVLFAPAFIYLFPQIPEWVAQLFPTYYVIQPVVQLSQGSSGWADIATSVYVLLALDALLVGAVMLVLRRVKQYAI